MELTFDAKNEKVNVDPEMEPLDALEPRNSQAYTQSDG